MGWLSTTNTHRVNTALHNAAPIHARTRAHVAAALTVCSGDVLKRRQVTGRVGVFLCFHGGRQVKAGVQTLNFIQTNSCRWHVKTGCASPEKKGFTNNYSCYYSSETQVQEQNLQFLDDQHHMKLHNKAWTA